MLGKYLRHLSTLLYVQTWSYFVWILIVNHTLRPISHVSLSFHMFVQHMGIHKPHEPVPFITALSCWNHCGQQTGIIIPISFMSPSAFQSTGNVSFSEMWYLWCHRSPWSKLNEAMFCLVYIHGVFINHTGVLHFDITPSIVLDTVTPQVNNSSAVRRSLRRHQASLLHNELTLLSFLTAYYYIGKL